MDSRGATERPGHRRHTMPNGTKAVIARGHYFIGEAVTVIAPYAGPFGPSVLVRRANGREMAVKVADLDAA